MTDILHKNLSFCVVHPLQIIVNNKCIASGTGFFYSHQQKIFFITAGHNITGKNPETGKILGIPDEIQIFLYKIEKKDNDEVLSGYSSYKIKLYNAENQPVWLEHPTYKAKIDVVAIPVELAKSGSLIPINEVVLQDSLPISAGMDLFILGYPHGYMSYPHICPIWKRGTLATEFAINIDRMPKSYIDATTAKGMSGAPVIAQQNNYIPTDKKDISNLIIGIGRSFIGVYTGRYTDAQTNDLSSSIFNAQLGIMWKKSVIDEIIAHY